MKDSYTSVLKMLGERKETDTEALVWITVVLLGLPLLLFFGNYLRNQIQRHRNRAQAFDSLERLGGQKGLTYPEQMACERMARVAGLQNPALLLTSIDVFDRAVVAWMGRVQQMPWLEMEKQVDLLRSIRKKVGFRYLPPERPPVTTRELKLGQKLYTLTSGPDGLQLLSTPIVDLDDLAIRTKVFEMGRHPVRLREHQDMWIFFWSDVGGEYQFKAHILKTVRRPASYLILQHGDALVADKGRKIFSCDMDQELTGDWVSSRDGRSVPSVTLFEDGGRAKSICAHLKELSGSGFSVATDAEIQFNDLIRFGDMAPDFLKGKVGRVVGVSNAGIRCKFHKLSVEDRETILKYVTPRISSDVFRKTKRRESRPMNA